VAWVFLALAGLLEVAFTTMLQLVKSSGSWIAVGGFALCVILSFVFLELATRSIPVGTAYASGPGSARPAPPSSGWHTLASLPVSGASFSWSRWSDR
jgi:hypothetical protein